MADGKGLEMSSFHIGPSCKGGGSLSGQSRTPVETATLLPPGGPGATWCLKRPGHSSGCFHRGMTLTRPGFQILGLQDYRINVCCLKTTHFVITSLICWWTSNWILKSSAAWDIQMCSKLFMGNVRVSLFLCEKIEIHAFRGSLESLWKMNIMQKLYVDFKNLFYQCKLLFPLFDKLFEVFSS